MASVSVCPNNNTIATVTSNQSYGDCNTLETVYIDTDTLAPNQFHEAVALKEVHVNDSLSVIPDHAFSYTNLTLFLNFVDIITIGIQAFYNTPLSNYIFLNNTVTIGAYAFAYTDIQGVVLNSITIIGNGAFYACLNLVSITFGKHLNTISPDAFYSTAVVDVSLPASLISIGQGAFAFCESLQTITYEGSPPSSITANVFQGTQCPDELTKNAEECSNAANIINPAENCCQNTSFTQWILPNHACNISGTYKCVPCQKCASYERQCTGFHDAICQEPKQIQLGFIVTICLYVIYSVVVCVFYVVELRKKRK